MKLLALDTATELCSAALYVEGSLQTRELRAPRAHGALVLQMIDELLCAAGLELAAIDAIAFGRGPGAFTGLRLACAIAQGLGFAAARPLIPVSDLRALAAQALQAPQAPDRILVCQDARMQEVYWGCFERVGAVPQLLGAEVVAPPGAVRLPSAWAGAAVGGAGSGFAAYGELRARLGSSLASVLPDLLPTAAAIAQLAAHDGMAAALAPEQALPVYLRDQVTAVRP